MKIHPDQVNALNTEQTKADRKERTDGKFGDVLAQEVRKNQATETGTVGGVKPLQALLRAEAASEEAQHIPQGREIMDNLDSLLAEWENYAGKLGETSLGDSGLKEAYGVLEGISSGVRELKSKTPDLEQQHPGLKSMIDELEILAATEQIKFVRGDYS